MPNVSGQAYALTVLTPIVPGREIELRTHLEGLASGPGSPLAQTDKTHVARWVIIDQLVYQGKPQKPDRLQSQYLLFESSFDGGELDPYLDDLCRCIPAELDAVWGCCVGYPGADPEKFKAYIRHNQIDAAFFVAAYPEATVSDVRESLAFRDRFIDFAIEAQGLDARALYDAFHSAFPTGDGTR